MLNELIKEVQNKIFSLISCNFAKAIFFQECEGSNLMHIHKIFFDKNNIFLSNETYLRLVYPLHAWYALKGHKHLDKPASFSCKFA